jgi:ribosomal protein S6--L-glutamate ligase
MKIHLLLNQRLNAEPNPVFAVVIDILEHRGFTVTRSVPEESLLSPDKVRADADVYVLKSRSDLALSVAGVLHERGGRFINPYPSCALLQNRITAASALAAAGIPVPRSWVTGDFSLLRDLASVLPLIIKPSRAQRGTGPVVVRCRSDLTAMSAPTQPMIVQPLIPGTDLKVYVVGDEVFAMRKRLSGRNFGGVYMPCSVSPEVRDIALRCGRVFGLGLYGLDIIESSGGPVVVDLDYAPGYRGVPDIAPLIARYMEQFACGVVEAGGSSETPAHCAEPAPADAVAEPV